MAKSRLLRWLAPVAGFLTIPMVTGLSPSAASAATGSPVAAKGPALEKVQSAAAVPAGARALGAVAANATVSGEVVLKPRDENAVKAFISEVTNKHSAQYHQYLAPGAYAARFGPTPATIATVASALKSSGLAVTSVASDNLLVKFSGAASRVESAFHTSLESYRLSDGTIGQGTTSAVQLPSSIASSVSSVIGLDQLVHAQSQTTLAPLKGGNQVAHPAAKTASFVHYAGAPNACPDATSAAAAFGGLTDDQIANYYGATGLYSTGDLGAGQRIAVYELEPFSMDDLATFDSCYGVQGTDRVSVINVDGGQNPGTGGGEAILDVEDVSAIAPAANIDVYQAPNTTFGGIDEYAQIINNTNPDTFDRIVTSSWGLCEQAVQLGEPGVQQAENLLFEQAAAQGQSVFNAAGDTGSNDCNAFRTITPVSPVLSVDDPASQPYVVSVGGTTIDDATQPSAASWPADTPAPSEHVWNDGAAWGAAGGGISESWPMPTWQLDSPQNGVSNAGPDNPAVVSAAESFEQADLGNPGYRFCQSDAPVGQVEAACREVPDVSAQADEFTGAITIYTQLFGPGSFGWGTIGGTSSATPIWAALLALIDESPTCQANPATSSGVGFVSPLLYSTANNPSTYFESFNDIQAGNNDPYGASNLFPATKLYDMASGLGTPALTRPGGEPGLAANLCAAAVSATMPTVTSLSPSSASTASPEAAVTITGSGFAPNGTPDVADIQVGTTQFPVSDGLFTVDSDTQISAVFPPSFLVLPPNDPTDGAGAYQVIVTLNDGETNAPSPNSVFTYVDTNGGGTVPAVTSVHTYAGPSAGGNSVDIYGTGFTGATDVSFGGVSVGAGNFTVVNDHDIRATVPTETGSTDCVQNGSTYDATFGLSQDASNDICQTEVVVTNANGSSATSTILPLYEGDFASNIDALGVLPPPNNTEEVNVQPTEYDYVPAPTITSVSTVDGQPQTYASENPANPTTITITGSGFNLATLDWINFGDPTQASSQINIFGQVLFISGTKLVLLAPGEPPTTDQADIPVSVQTLGGLSDPVNAIYAGVPSVTGVATSGPGSGSDLGIAAAPDTGGNGLTITGAGFSDTAPGFIPIEFADSQTPFSFGTQYNYSPDSDTSISTSTVPQNPALLDVEVCTVTACSFPTSFDSPPFSPDNPPPNADELILYPNGTPSVDAVTPSSGPATGGTPVTITGTNLGCVTNVTFGGVQALRFNNTPQLLDCGSTTSVQAVAPPGAVGSTVPVQVTTVASDVNGTTPTSTASFHYLAVPPAFTADSPPAHAVVHVPYSYTFHAFADPAPTYSVSSGSLPPGLHLSTASGKLSGTPTTIGTYHFKVTASNGAAPAAVTPLLTITVVHASDTGYWEATAAGGVYPFGAALPHGSLGGMHLNKPIVGIAATPDGGGYWLVATDGGVFPFGDAKFYGSLGNVHLNRPIVAIAASATGHGYWLVASDGGIFQFGDAKFHGSLGDIRLNKPIVGMAATFDGGGYWLVASDGGIFQFGNAKFHGSLGNIHLNQPIRGMAATYDGGGYWLVAADGGIFQFGSAGFYGSGGSMGLGTSVEGMAATPDTQGYALVTSTGAVIPFGDFTGFGSVSNQLTSPVIGAAVKG